MSAMHIEEFVEARYHAFAINLQPHNAYVEKFLELLYDRPPNTSLIYYVLGYLNALLSFDHFADCDYLLRVVDLERIDDVEILGIVDFTKPATTEQLPTRADFVRRAEAKLVESLGATRAHTLLAHRR